MLFIGTRKIITNNFVFRSRRIIILYLFISRLCGAGGIFHRDEFIDVYFFIIVRTISFTPEIFFITLHTIEIPIRNHGDFAYINAIRHLFNLNVFKRNCLRRIIYKIPCKVYLISTLSINMYKCLMFSATIFSKTIVKLYNIFPSNVQCIYPCIICSYETLCDILCFEIFITLWVGNFAAVIVN